MRNFSKAIGFIFLLISILNPLLVIRVTSIGSNEEQLSDSSIIEPAAPSIFVVGACGPRDITHWDPCTYVPSTGDYYMDNALESLFAFPYHTTGHLDELQPLLATSWTYEYRPNEMNAAGFINYGGIKSMEITLRAGVQFHDGSEWNATVCKWNIDRLMTILGNISGVLPIIDGNVHAARDMYWLEVNKWAEFETASWNVTQFDGIPASYAEYGVSGDLISRFPRFANVTIIEDLSSGGKVKIFFNDWQTGPSYLKDIEMISMETYKDYFDTIIYGYGNNPAFPQDNPAIFPGHLIGTGPYIFDGHEMDIGTMHRNINWWNATAQQAEGWHQVENVAVATFAHTEAGYQARSTAMITGDVHFAYDREWEPLNYEDMIAAPNVYYIPLGIESYGENIILNCINETFMKTFFADMGYNMSPWYSFFSGPFMASGIMNPDYTINTDGVNRAFRKAISYAFDYDTYVHIALNDRVVRSGGLLGKTNAYYNSSIPIAYQNLTIARQALLDDPFWGALCAARGLTAVSVDADWHFVADTNPIYTMEYSFDQAHLEAYSVMLASLRDIGCDMDAWVDIPDTYTKMSAYFTFPWFTTDGFAMKLYYPRYDVLPYIQTYYKSPASMWLPWPFDQFYNMGFNYNSTCDDLIERMWFQNSTGVQDSYNKLADWTQNYQYPCIYLANDLVGYAINNYYEYTWYWESFKFNFVKIALNLFPVADFTVNTTSILEGQWINFTFTGDEGNPSATYQWDFGDGHFSTSQNPIHQYTTSGTYTVSLNVTDANGDSDNENKIDLITVIPDLFPQSDFTADSTTIIAYETIEFNFTGTIGNSPATFLWDFGDGDFSTNQNPTHLYTTVGTYTVSLTVTDMNGDEDTETKTDYIIVEEPPSNVEILGYETNLIIGIISITMAVIILKKPKSKIKIKGR